MTELETLQRAKMYIDKMANGINPLTDECVSENDMVNSVRISRCLFYVSGVLDKVIENGGAVKPSKNKGGKNQFFITEEQQLSLTVSEAPIYLKNIVEEINRVTAENNTVSMQSAWINSWLVELGMLEVVGKHKVATEQGAEIGISTEVRQSEKYGEYYANSYSPSAQAFVYDNILAVVAHHYN